MISKVAFLCTDPWESFLPVVLQSHSRDYFQWLCSQSGLEASKLHIRKVMDIYGGEEICKETPLFAENESSLQLLYVQSRRERMLEKVFKKSDLVVMGLPGCKKEFEQIFMSVLPWREQILFLWERQRSRGEEFLKRLCNEYKLRETQLLEITGEIPRLF